MVFKFRYDSQKILYSSDFFQNIIEKTSIEFAPTMYQPQLICTPEGNLKAYYICVVSAIFWGPEFLGDSQHTHDFKGEIKIRSGE